MTVLGLLKSGKVEVTAHDRSGQLDNINSQEVADSSNFIMGNDAEGGVRFSSAFHSQSQVGQRVREMINSLTTHLKEETSEDIEHKRLM